MVKFLLIEYIVESQIIVLKNWIGGSKWVAQW